ncbi:MAG: HPr family phosphocarrier protein [Thermoanaerobaculia bacterium]|nr:HPr family phosphocarrier protein [Thermoanaerobaculia bacterium]
MIERELEIENRLGLHARAAAKLVHLASRFESSITIEENGERVDAKSILGVLLLAAAQGCTITVRCDGRDEQEAMTAIADLLADKFGEGE